MAITSPVRTASDGTHPITEMEGSSVPGKLEVALSNLQASLDAFPPLKLAVGGLLECVTNLKIVNQNRQAHEEILEDIANLVNAIPIWMTVSKPPYTPYSIDSVARSIEDQTRHIRELRDRSRGEQPATTEEDEENVLKSYRELRELFSQIQTDILLRKWEVLPDQHVEMRLHGLAPAKGASYNAAVLETTNNQHIHAANVQTRALAESVEWMCRGDATKIYWMDGVAGTGKTTVAYSLCKLLEADERLGASFFCSRYSPTRRDIGKIVPTVAYQLARQSSPYRQALCRVLEADPDLAKQDVKTQFESLIVKPRRSLGEPVPGGLVAVIDGLEECSDPTGAVQFLGLLFQHAAELPIKVFVTSQPEPALVQRIIEQGLISRSIVHQHHIEESLVQADIRAYLGSALVSLKLPADYIDLLTARAGRLFIFAVTVVRYILPRDVSVDREERLSLVLRSISKLGAQTQGYKALDKLYSIILVKALQEGETHQNEAQTGRCVLWTAICARDTMHIATLSKLLNISEEKVERATKSLHPVLDLSTATGAVSILGTSFSDFLLDHSRSGPFYCDRVKHSTYLAGSCFRLMEQCLRFNICDLESSYRPDRDVPQLQARVDKEISTGLFYASQYWSDHLSFTVTSGELLSALEEFLTYRLLFWIEVLSLKRCVQHGERILNQVLRWLPSDATYLTSLTYDARSFVARSAANLTSRGTPHIYISILPFTSKQSHVRAIYWPRTQGLVQIDGSGIEAGERSALATWATGSWVHSIALSGDGKSVVSGSDDHTVSVWSLCNGDRILGPLKGHEGSVWSVAFSPDSGRVASASMDCTLRLWDAQNGSLIAGPLCGHIASVNSVAFSPDGAHIASGSGDSTIRMWDAHTGAPVGKAFKGHQGPIMSVGFSPNGTHLASGSNDCTIRVWDLQAGTLVQGPMEGHTYAVWSIAYSHDGLRLASGSEDCTVRVWNTSDGALLVGPLEGHTSGVNSVLFSPDDTRIASGSTDGTICIWETISGRVLARPREAHTGSINSVLFTADGTRILSGSDDQTIRMWDARQGSGGATKSLGHIGGILSVTLSPDGSRVASGSSDHTICVWDLHDGALVAGPFIGHTDSVTSVAFSPDGARIVSSSDDNTLRMWDASTGALLVGPIEERAGSDNPVAFSPDGSRFASGSYGALWNPVIRTIRRCISAGVLRKSATFRTTPADTPHPPSHAASKIRLIRREPADFGAIRSGGAIRLWNAHTGASIAKPFEVHEHFIESIAFSPDGARIVSGSRDETVRMWDVNGITAPLWTSEAPGAPVDSVAFSPDGMRVASGSCGDTIYVLDASDGAVLYGPFMGHTHRVLSVAFSPDGTQLVSGSFDQTVRMWNVESGTTVIGPLKGHTEAVRSVAFSPDGTRIISGSDDQTIRVWDLAAIDRASPTSADDWSIDDEGWLNSSKSQRLLWVPSHLRRGFGLLSPSSPIVINADCTARIEDTALLGDRWHECYNTPLASGSS